MIQACCETWKEFKFNQTSAKFFLSPLNSGLAMSSWFRSTPMTYVSLLLNADAAPSTLSLLGSLSSISFTDLNPDLTPFQRRYIGFVKRCDELERKLRFFGGECDKFNLAVSRANGGALRNQCTAPYQPNVLDTLESELEGYESQLRELNSFSAKLTTEYNEKVELQEVLLKGREFYEIDAPRLMTSSVSERMTSRATGGRGDSLLDDDRANLPMSMMADGGAVDRDMRFSSVTGVVDSAEKARFERMLFRSTRGNCYVRFAGIEQDIVDPETNCKVKKHVFIIFFKSKSIETKIKKICDAFSAHRYSIPSVDDPQAFQSMLAANAQELNDSHTVLVKNQDTRFRMCQMLANCIEEWTWKVVKEKAIYHSLNMFKSDVSGMLRGEGWIISSQLASARAAVTDAHSSMDLAMPSLLQPAPQPWPSPPTHFETNAFTYAYQEFVNTYGVPRYREANPALFTAATFPFLFGVMYGDIGHGTCLFLAGLFLMYSYNADSKYDEMMGGVYSARYMITAMGFFGIYAGFIYNDFFSLGLNLFTSRYEYPNQDEGAEAVESGAQAVLTADYGSSEAIYPVGMDPAWHVSSNELLFFNSFKMKLSVVLGIIQMFGGTCLKGMNAIYFGERLDFFFEFLPMVAFAGSLFVYMIILIVMKWSINWNSRMLSASCCEFGDGGLCHPVTSYVDGVATTAGTPWGDSQYEGVWAEECVDADGAESEYCTPWGYSCEGSNQVGGDVQYSTADLCPLDFGGTGDGCQPPNLITLLINIALQPGNVDEPLYAGQATIQNILLFIAFASVPILLLAKPYLLSKQHENEGAHGEHDDDDDDDSHGFGEILIHQAIETIEFVLGMVSNTASYLRLWALSLAHSKLAGVFWEKAMLSTINMNFFAAFIGFGIFAAVTTGVLLMMDVLECFLHALR
ncbi:hypothetical protein TrRE_jg6357, partial [Triparma retinervis]